MPSTSGRSIWSRTGGRKQKASPRTAFGLRHRCVKSQRGFAGTAQAGNHRQRVAGDFDVYILEVMLARPAHRNLVIAMNSRELDCPSVIWRVTESWKVVCATLPLYPSC